MARARKWTKEQHEKFSRTMAQKGRVKVTDLEEERSAAGQAVQNKGEREHSAARPISFLPVPRKSRLPARLAIYGKRVTIAANGTVTVEDMK